MEHESLARFLKNLDSHSKFNSELGLGGGYVNFENSGQRGSVKEFTLSLSSILSGLEDIRDNITHFSTLSNYREKDWRDAGAKYFKDKVLNSMITVQTKPCFTTLSKIINWANNIEAYDDDLINLSDTAISNTISKLKQVIDSFTPVKSKHVSDNKRVISVDQKISIFVYKVLNYLLQLNKFDTIVKYLKASRDGSENYSLEYNDIKLGGIFRVTDINLTVDDLISGPKIRYIESPLQFDNKNYYLSTEWTVDKDSRLLLANFKAVIESLFPDFVLNIDSKPYQLMLRSAQSTASYLKLSKSFLLLAGISGTGKTRFVREQADNDLSNYQLVSVRPDWHEPSDLLGYVTRLTQPEQYVATEVLVFIVKAWREVVGEGFELSGKTASGDTSNIENIRPFWLCLDEMNLAPVEQYFADYLSVSETRRWVNDDGELIYSCDTLLNRDLINSVDKDKLKKDLGLDDGGEVSDKLWEHFCDNGISIPFNLIVAGTVNMDETTHGFSRKVIDRALSFDFGEFFPNVFSEFFESITTPKSLTYPIWSHADRDSLATTCDPEGERTIKFMEAINEKLDGTPFKLAYRALNEILLSIIANNPLHEQELLAVWDDFVMCKLLPRIEGDLDKLSSEEDDKSLLQVLSEALAADDMLGLIWDEQKDSPDARPDLYREKTEGDDKEIRIPCRSREKLDWMQARLERDTFTSFWP